MTKAKKLSVDVNEFGLCLKSKDWTVRWQNGRCENICGNQTGRRCQKNCQDWTAKRNTTNEDGALVFQGKRPDEKGPPYDVVVCQNGKEILSILVPAEAKTQKRVESYRAAGLSEREIEVQQLRDLGLARAAICDRLFISLATLKTHLNRIRHKLASMSL